MSEKRFTITQKEDYFYVRDEVNKKPLGVFEFKQDEFPVYFCFHKIIDLLNSLSEENKRLKSDNKEYIKGLDLAKATSQSWASDVRELREENCRLEKKNERLIKKIKRERASTTKQHLKWSDEAEEIINDLRKENEQLKYEVNSLMEDLGYIDAELEELEDIDKNVIR